MRDEAPSGRLRVGHLLCGLPFWLLDLLKRRRRLCLYSGLFVVAALLLTPLLLLRAEERLAARLHQEAERHGLLLQFDSLTLGLWPAAQVRGVTLGRPDGTRVSCDSLRLYPALWGRGWLGPLIRVRVERTVALLPRRTRITLLPSTWDVRPTRRSITARLRRGAETLEISRQRQTRAPLRVRAAGLRSCELFTLEIGSRIRPCLGTVKGEAELSQPDASSWHVELHGGAAGASIRALARNADTGDGPPPPPGTATDIQAQLSLTWHAREERLSIETARLESAGAIVSAKAVVQHATRDPEIDLTVVLERIDFARLLPAAGIAPPTGPGGLGSLSLQASVVGRALEPRSFVVKERVDFVPPSAPAPEILRLRGPFTHHATNARGQRRVIIVAPTSPDFIPLEEVPALFLRGLLISEDASFYGHRGVDLSSIPAALAMNWRQGGALRGASTITQQLAKNLFLSRQKSVTRKLQELVLALLIETTLGKQRILEIYLNIIEWGPNLYGLRPAARHYFGLEPSELSPKQMAFLITLIPGPIKYQRSIASGSPTPAFESLMARLLTKLRSVDAITEEEYQTALAEPVTLSSALPALEPSSDPPDEGEDMEDSLDSQANQSDLVGIGPRAAEAAP
jgi:hypothetical protein